MDINRLVEEAGKVFLSNHSPETCFERALFFSWHCSIGDCSYCYMSTQPKNRKKPARRSMESLLAEVLLCKRLGWDLGFVSGGHGAYTRVEFEKLLENIHLAYGKKTWINVGALKKEELQRYRPYIMGVVGSIETINPKLHRKVCPSKPVEPFESMYEQAGKLGLNRAMTIIIGLGETMDDFPLLESFIRKHSISKIHIYSLNPQKGTVFENTSSPRKEYHAEWIARTRIAFPSIDIQAGIWLDRVDTVSLLLRAGASSISKFPALRYFGSSQSAMIEKEAGSAGRKFTGTLTRLPHIDPDGEVRNLMFPGDLKLKIKDKLSQYILTMRKSIKNRA